MQQQVIAHRGARGLWAENSLFGFRNTLALGPDAVEFDVHPTRDGGLAVIHDATLDRTTNASGIVSDHTSTELRAMRLAGVDEGVPSLQEVLDILVPSRLPLHLELKADANGKPYAGLPESVLAELDRRAAAGQTILTSFDPAVLEHLRRLRAEQALLVSINAKSAMSYGGLETLLDRLDGIGVDYVAVEQGLLANRFAYVASRIAPPRLCAWVINQPEDIAHWTAAPVGLITSDRPDLVLAARAEAVRRHNKADSKG